jgi:tetratricopeptide (TPR) repeat protein
MSGRPLISMVMIARNEERNVEPCFSSWWDHVDEIVLVDTGSTDRTVETATRFARKRKALHKLKLGRFEWADDFAAARNYAHSLASGEWHCWCDLDDEIAGAEHLRDLAASAPADVQALMFDYEYARDQAGNVICTLRRERLVRAGSSEWFGRVHEAQKLDGQVQLVPAGRVVWRHRKQAGDTPSDRNLQILERWAQDEPANGRVIQYLGTERAGNGLHAEAVEAYRQYLQLSGEPEEHRAQVWRKLACSLIALERVEEAFRAGVEALAENPTWPDCYLTLAQTAYIKGEHVKVLEWAAEAIRRGQPDSLLILNPLDYTVEPRVAMAGSLAALGRLDEAIGCAEQALAVVPEHPLLAPTYRQWLVERKRSKTVETWLSCCQMLVGHDEQQKALDLLERTVPYYAVDDPRVVQARSELRERLAFAKSPGLYAEHYAVGGSKPEDMVADENVTPLCEALPRTQFLKRHVAEMLEPEQAAA